MFSPRNLYNLVSRAADYRFEDIIARIDDAHVVAPNPGRSWQTKKRVSNRLATRFARTINPGVRVQPLTQRYDLFFAKCLFAPDLLARGNVGGATRRSR